MEKFYIVTNSEYLLEVKQAEERKIQQINFIKKIFEEHGIFGESYMLCGNGGVNKPFEDNNKKEISLAIEAIDSNLEKFSKHLCKTKGTMAYFKKSSSVLKDIQNKCVEERIIINLRTPYLGDYFHNLYFGGYRRQQFKKDGKLYLLIESEKLKDEKVEGFNEIKGSEYYLALENKEYK